MSAGRPATPVAPQGFTFRERMAGRAGWGAEDYRAGRRDGESLWFKVAVEIPNLRAFRNDPQHRAALRGTVGGSLIGGEYPIEEGQIELLAPANGGGHREMRYALSIHRDGEPIRLEGFKDVRNNYVLDFWPDTTRLFATLTAEGREPARGILTLAPWALVPQVMSFRALGRAGARQHLSATARFLTFFAGTLAGVYLRPPRRKS